ncbi:MAG: MotA/TolQ/ExbB proton channel family protein, partial [Myxococcota bacterium]|nr:MotA/TolQ/ExbB proton channel family protein [Myxococcota bacterium]
MQPTEAIWAVRDFIEMGGNVLLVIAFVTGVMWTLILERFWYFRMSYPVDRNLVLGDWSARAAHGSWQAHQIRRLLISQTRTRLTENLGMIRTLVAVCPMLGL